MIVGPPGRLLAGAVDGRERQPVGLFLGQGGGRVRAQYRGVASDLLDHGIEEPLGLGPDRVRELTGREPLSFCAFSSHVVYLLVPPFSHAPQIPVETRSLLYPPPGRDVTSSSGWT